MRTTPSQHGPTSIARSAVALVGSRVAAQGLAIALTVLLAARIGLRSFGEYAFVSAIVFVANVVTTFGTDMLLIRDIAADRRVDRCAPALVLQLLLSTCAITLVVAVVAILPAGHAEAGGALLVMSLSLLPAAVFTVCTAVLRGEGKMHSYAAVTVVAAAAPLLGVAALVPEGADVVRAATALVIAQTASAAVAWGACALRAPHTRIVARVPASAVVETARASAGIGVLGLLGVAYQRCGAIAVTIVSGPVATGWLAGASRITDASKTGHVALFTSVYPAMAEARTGRRSHRALEWSWRASVGAAALIAVVLQLAGPTLVSRLYGPAFAPAAAGLAVLALSVVPSTIATHESLALLAADRAPDTLRALGIGFAVLVAATAVLLPSLGWIGACWAMLIADTTTATLMGVAHRREARRAAGRSTSLPATLLRRGVA